jgi:hypothetical protein
LVELAEIQTAYYMVAATGVLVAAVFYILNLRVSQRNQELALKAQQQSVETRQTQLFMQVMDKMDQSFLDDFWEIQKEWKWTDYDDFEKRYGPDVNSKFRRVFGVMMHMGILVEEGLLDPRLIRFWMGNQISSLWGKYESVILAHRVKYEAPGKGTFLDYFEDLAIVMERCGREDLERLGVRQERGERRGLL